LLAGAGLPGAAATATIIGEPSLLAAEVLGPAFQVWAPEEQCNSAAGTGEPNLQIEDALGPTCQCKLLGAMIAAAGSQEQILLLTGALGPACCKDY
jgi:hypothetical protein